MVLIAVVRDYINRMLHDISGMKVLILDSQTVFFRALTVFLFVEISILIRNFFYVSAMVLN